MTAKITEEEYVKAGEALLADHDPEREDAWQYFAYSHLPSHLQGASKPFADLAQNLIASLPRCPQRTMMLNKLVEAKDHAVRAALWKAPKR